MSKDPMEPGRRLLKEGLLHEDCIYGDPVMVLRGAHFPNPPAVRTRTRGGGGGGGTGLTAYDSFIPQP